MTTKKFQAIIDRYLAGKSTPSEQKLVNNFLAAQEKGIDLNAQVPRDGIWNSIETALHKELNEIENPKRISRSYIIVSILVLVIIAISFFIYSSIVTTSEPTSKVLPYVTSNFLA